MLTDSIIYEQPLAEHLRICLRLEHLFQQATHNLQNQSVWGSHTTLSALLEMLAVTDRADLKTRLARALNDHAERLAALEQVPGVDRQKLRHVLDQLDQLADGLHAIQGKVGQPLRGNDFLNTVRMHMGNPGGACGFSVPAYFLWQHQPAAQRVEALAGWLKEFDLLRTIVTLLLQLTRESGKAVLVSAPGGFYSEGLDPTVPHQMIRVAVPQTTKVYPEISVGRHHLSIHFFVPNTHGGRPAQSTHDIQFKLTCCA